MLTKTDLRRLMRDRLAQPPELRAEKSARICAAITALPQWPGARTVAMFAPLPREPDIDPLWLHTAGKVLAYPRVEFDTMALYAVSSLLDLRPARWDIREPAPRHLIAPGDIDLILVPGVAFTRAGGRCGRGGGFYDRFLASLPASTLAVGVCFDFQIVDEVPLEAHDHLVNLVITENSLA